jgi:hypothetical protein
MIVADAIHEIDFVMNVGNDQTAIVSVAHVMVKRLELLLVSRAA